eukprot:TRINITY_DN96210_c0_g1_i1.p1 TRINITY_DN96210_c0_g1~~TRINITY_DN96210_c0_g1_i1.p1  ORF type:complete len:209 (-),score=30.61 TRINITY_DN96210_c0_g1_i1:103-729(-)
MVTPGQLQMYNKLEVAEMFSLGEAARCRKTGIIKRIHVQPDEKVPDACLFTIWLEDHTLGNMLRMELLRNDMVIFAGYKVPHPLNHMIELRVQTLPKSSPEIALRRAVANLRSEFSSMLGQFDRGCKSWKEKTAGLYDKPMLEDVPMIPTAATPSPDANSEDIPYRAAGEAEDTAFDRLEAGVAEFRGGVGGQGGGYSPAAAPAYTDT